MYRILVSESAADFIRGQTKKIRRQIYRKINNLRDDPYPQKCVKLRGEEDLYRITSGDYRIIYKVQSKKITILVLRVGHRKEVYRTL